MMENSIFYNMTCIQTTLSSPQLPDFSTTPKNVFDVSNMYAQNGQIHKPGKVRVGFIWLRTRASGGILRKR
jgi:hypothetical protein